MPGKILARLNVPLDGIISIKVDKNIEYYKSLFIKLENEKNGIDGP